MLIEITSILTSREHLTMIGTMIDTPGTDIATINTKDPGIMRITTDDNTTVIGNTIRIVDMMIEIGTIPDTIEIVTTEGMKLMIDTTEIDTTKTIEDITIEITTDTTGVTGHGTKPPEGHQDLIALEEDITLQSADQTTVLRDQDMQAVGNTAEEEEEEVEEEEIPTTGTVTEIGEIKAFQAVHIGPETRPILGTAEERVTSTADRRHLPQPNFLVLRGTPP